MHHIGHRFLSKENKSGHATCYKKYKNMTINSISKPKNWPTEWTFYANCYLVIIFSGMNPSLSLLMENNQFELDLRNDKDICVLIGFLRSCNFTIFQIYIIIYINLTMVCSIWTDFFNFIFSFHYFITILIYYTFR